MSFTLKSLGPSVGHVSALEALRAAIGATVALGIVGLLVLSPLVNLQTGLYLVAPFGATSVLLFAVPNSPLAQPWSAVVGNTVAALVAVAVCLLVTEPILRVWSRPGRDASDASKGQRGSVAAQTTGSACRWNVWPDFSIACMMTASLRATATAARLKPIRSRSCRPQVLSALSAVVLVSTTVAAS